MIPPSEYDRLCNQLITLYDDLENAIISDIVRRIMKTGRITESAEWQIKQLQESGMLYDDILAEIAKRTDATSQHVKALFEDAGVQSIRNDNRYYRAAGLAGIVKMSDAALQTLNAGYVKCGGNLQNLTMTTAFTSQQAYITACNNAYMQVTSGAFSYQEAIRNAIKSAAAEGTHVLYPSGHKDRIDVAVRRAVLTGVGQTVRKLSVINAEDMGCDIMEITAHSGARPSHAAWQGKLVSLSGKNAGKIIEGCRVLSLSEIGYGSGDGFGGWNCRHDWYPFFEGISHRAYSDERLKQLDEKNIEYNGTKYSEYEISQIQRRYEREIRAAKREQVAFRTAVEEAQDPELKAVMQDSLNYANSALKDKQAKMRDFIKQTGQFRDYSREQNYGRVAYSKNSVKDLTSVSNSGKIEVPKTLLGYEKAKDAYMEKIKNTEIMKPENREAVEKALKTLIDKGDFCMRIEESTLKTIADSEDKRFKTQIETKTSGGAYNPEYRKKATEILFGADSSKVPDTAFEKYGFLAGKDKSITFADKEAYDYGDIIIQFNKNKLFDRTTFTVGDSLNSIEDSLVFAGKVSEPSVCAVPQDNFIDKTIETSIKFNNGLTKNHIEFCHEAMVDYIELQYHGDLSLNDVEAVYYQGNIDYSLKSKLEKSGIKIIKIES